MPRKKLAHYAFTESAENVIQRGKPLYTGIKGRWRDLYFKNSNPLVVELACGKGEYSIGMGKQFPEKNFVGLDIKGDRIARGSLAAIEAGLDNVAFLRAGIQFANEFFEKDELSEVWLIHPDPQVRDRDEVKRLTNPSFLDMYAGWMPAGGSFCLKTDSTFLYDYSMQILGDRLDYKIVNHTDDLYNSPLLEEHFDVRTHYEKIFVAKGHTIKYIRTVRI